MDLRPDRVPVELRARLLVDLPWPGIATRRRLALAALAVLVAASAAGCVVEDPRYFGSYLFWYNRDRADYVLAQDGGDGYYVLPGGSEGSMPVHGAGPYTVLVIATPGCGVAARVAAAALEHVVVAGGAAAVGPRTGAAPDVPELKGTEWCLGRVPGLPAPTFAP